MKRFVSHISNKELDRDLELNYFGARYYQPEFPRFLSPDPVGGTPEVPISWNRYLYCRNDPINMIDPDGENPFLAAAGLYLLYELIFSDQTTAPESEFHAKAYNSAAYDSVDPNINVISMGRAIGIDRFGASNAAYSQGTCGDQARYMMNELSEEYGDIVSPIAGVKKDGGVTATHAALLVDDGENTPFVIDPYNNSTYSLDEFLAEYPIVLQYFDDYRLDESGSTAVNQILQPTDALKAGQLAEEMLQD